MSVESKYTLKAQNQSSFPNNSTGYITPEILRDYNINIIDSLVDEISYGAYTASVTSLSASIDIRLDNLESFSSSLDTNFASQTEFNSYTSSNDTKWNDLGNKTGSYVTSAITASSVVTASVSQSTITFTKGDGTQFNITVADISGSGGTTNTGSLLLTASFDNGTRNLTFTKGDNTTFNVNIPDVSGSTIDTASFATTGSNTFTGQQTFQDAGLNSTTLVSTSGSLMFVAKTFTSASENFTASANNLVNLIFKNNNNTNETVISGSINIFTNPAAPSTGFKRFMGQHNIFLNSSSVPQITQSATFPVNLSDNISTRGVISVVGPISSSASSVTNNVLLGAGINVGTSGTNNAEKLIGGFSIVSNLVMNGAQTIIANQNNISTSIQFTNNQCVSPTTVAMSSSAMVMAGNLLNTTGNNIRNAYYSSSIGLGTLTFARNIMQGATHNVLFTGSQPAGTTNAPQMAESQMMGTNLTAFVDVAASDTSSTTANHSIISTMVQGHNTIVTGSSATSLNNFGSAFFGRYNAQDGNRSKTAQTVFAVGTGNSTTRKTGFLIDSSSNTFIEGTLNVSGSTSGGIILTGSLQMTGSNLAITQGGTLVYNDKTILRFIPSIAAYTESYSRFDKDGLTIFQYQNQPYPFGLRYTADQLNDYTGSQIRVATTNDGVAYDDYIQYISASVTESSGTAINGIKYTNGLVINQTKPLLQQKLAYFDENVYISQSLNVTGSVQFNNNVTVKSGSVNITGSLSVNGNLVGAAINYAFVTSSYTTGSDDQVQTIRDLSIVRDTGFNITGSNNTGIKFENAGVYKIDYILQVQGNATTTIETWFNKNTTPISNTISAESVSSNEIVPIANTYIDNFAVDDVIELQFAASPGLATLYSNNSGLGPEVIPLRLSITQIS